jgi:CubicO group peptidase (beta-lactamase class C family)
MDEIERVATEIRFSGVVRIDRGGAVEYERAFGYADRAHQVAMTASTRIGVASGAKTFTALTVLALVERGALALDTPARSLLGADLPLIDASVTVEHLLAHRSGIGDYLDESLLDDKVAYVMQIPVHRMATPDEYLVALDGHPQVSPPGDRFAYNNAGYVVLAALAERAGGSSYHDLVDELVIAPAALTHTAFLRGDELPGDAALGYLHDEGLRTNVLHLPVRGVGDGGIATTAADVSRLWTALFDGRIVSPATVDTMTAPHSSDTGTTSEHRYGFGCWLPAGDGLVEMEGADAGASFRSTCRRHDRLIASVLSNTTDGAWPIANALASLF